MCDPVAGDRPACTVLVPTYNMAGFVESAIRSVLADPLEDVEVLVVDDGSSDATTEVIRTFTDPVSPDHDRRVTYHRQPNRGKSAALNAVLPRARGEYVTVLDADDELVPGGLEARHAAAREGGGRADMVIGGFDVMDKDGIVGTRRSPDNSEPRSLRRSYLTSFRTPFHLNACLLHRDLVERVGPFDERLRRCQDVDYALRCLEASHEVRVVDASVYWYRKNRRSRADRLRIRWSTLRHRVLVYSKAFAGPLAPAAVAVAVAGDVAKLVFNVFVDYEG